MTKKDMDQLIEVLKSLGTPQTKRVINFRNNRVERDFEVLDYTKLVIPQDCRIPETTEERIARVLYGSGQIDEVGYKHLTSRSPDSVFDDDGSDDFDMADYDEVTDAKLSPLATYEDFKKEYLSDTSAESGVSVANKPAESSKGGRDSIEKDDNGSQDTQQSPNVEDKE